MKNVGKSLTNIADFFINQDSLTSLDSFFNSVKIIPFKNLNFNQVDYYNLINFSNLSNKDLFLIKDDQYFDFQLLDRELSENLNGKRLRGEKLKVINKKIDTGHSLKIFDLHNYNPYLDKLARSFRSLFESNVSLNSYYTPKENSCFHAHRDHYPIIIFQIFGEKEWKIEKENSIEKKQTELDPRTCHNITLKSGEAIILPANYLHQCQTLASDSLHLTLGIHEISQTKFLVDLLEYKSILTNKLPSKEQFFYEEGHLIDKKELSFDKKNQYKHEITFSQFHYASFLNRHLFNFNNSSPELINYDQLTNRKEWYYFDEDHHIVLTLGAEITSTLPPQIINDILKSENLDLKSFMKTLESRWQIEALHFIKMLVKIGYFY